MGAYRAGDPVHVAGFGKGLVCEVRNHGRYLVELKGRAMEVDASRLSPLDAPHRTEGRGFSPGRAGGTKVPPLRTPRAGSALGPRESAGTDSGGTATLDLHGCTVDKAVDLLERALSDALLSNARELRVIHGKSGGRIKLAVHRRLGQLPSVRAFRVDAANSGVTTVVL